MATYSSKKVVVTYKGVRITGYADGDFLSANRTNDSFTKQVGADGEVARSASADLSGEITLTLLQTSASNDFLSQQITLDEKTLLGAGTLQVQDLNGTTVLLASEAWIKKAASAGFGKEAGSREWVFECSRLDIYVGGNL